MTSSVQRRMPPGRRSPPGSPISRAHHAGPRMRVIASRRLLAPSCSNCRAVGHSSQLASSSESATRIVSSSHRRVRRVIAANLPCRSSSASSWAPCGLLASAGSHADLGGATGRRAPCTEAISRRAAVREQGSRQSLIWAPTPYPMDLPWARSRLVGRAMRLAHTAAEPLMASLPVPDSRGGCDGSREARPAGYGAGCRAPPARP